MTQEKDKNDVVTIFTKLRDVCDDVLKAIESGDEKSLESAMGRFLFVCMEMDALKL